MVNATIPLASAGLVSTDPIILCIEPVCQKRKEVPWDRSRARVKRFAYDAERRPSETWQALADFGREIRPVTRDFCDFVDVTASLQFGKGQGLIEGAAFVEKFVEAAIDKDAPVPCLAV